ncbi:MAG: hypothetical protein NXI04_00910 [Planctomycetaceae bacterium]|nr:hypothetical protein [Planctomycetaceae bacterium]
MTIRSNPADAESTGTTTSDAHSVWVSSVIPGLTVQVIDPMPPTLDGMQSARDREPSSDRSAHTAESSTGDQAKSTRPKGKALSRLTPKKDPRSRYRRSRLLRLRETARYAAVMAQEPEAETENREQSAGLSADPRPAGSSAAEATARAEVSADADRLQPADRVLSSEVSAGVSAVGVSAVGAAPDADKSGDEGRASATDALSMDWFPVDEVSSDEVISISRSELGAAIAPVENAARSSATSRPSSRRRPLPAPLPIRPPQSVPADSLCATSPQSKPQRSAARTGGTRRSRGDRLEADTISDEKYADWFKRVVLRNRWLSIFTTFYIHWLILLALGMMVVHGPENAAALLLNGAFSEPEPPAQESFNLTVPEPVPLDDPQVTEQTDDAPQAAQMRAPDMDERLPELDESVMQGLLAGLTESETQMSPAVSQPATTAADSSPAPPRAVSEGSFSVWTEPSAPEAGEPYRIIVQIRLPPGMEQYDVSDLQGVVVGSDGYRKPIPGYLKGRLPVQDGYARLVIPIVSADEHVRDTVLIKSKSLKESQKLLIAFEPGV